MSTTDSDGTGERVLTGVIYNRTHIRYIQSSKVSVLKTVGVCLFAVAVIVIGASLLNIVVSVIERGTFPGLTNVIAVTMCLLLSASKITDAGIRLEQSEREALMAKAKAQRPQLIKVYSIASTVNPGVGD